MKLSVKNLDQCFFTQCLHYFYSEEELNQHIQDCMGKNHGAIKLPVGKHILQLNIVIQNNAYKVTKIYKIDCPYQTVLTNKTALMTVEICISNKNFTNS